MKFFSNFHNNRRPEVELLQIFNPGVIHIKDKAFSAAGERVEGFAVFTTKPEVLSDHFYSVFC